MSEQPVKVRECACVAGTCVLCVLALPLFAVVGVVLYTLMLAGVTVGTAWGIGSAVASPPAA